MFLNPILLWGLAGISVPVLIHLLNRFRHKEIRWGAMALLRRALVVRSRQVRLEDLLILALRCLAVALLALAMARPTLRTAGGLFGKGAQVGAVIGLDASFSMGHKPGVHSRFRRAVDRVREVLRTLEPGSPVSLVLLGARPRVLVPGTAYDRARLERVLADLEPRPERLNLEGALEELERRVHDLKAPARECYLVTDAQATTWAELSDEARHHLQRLGRAAKLFLLPTPPTTEENVAVARFALGSGTLRHDSVARYAVEVRNLGQQPRDTVALTLLVDGRPADRRVLERLGAGATTTVPLFARFARTGDVRLTVRAGHDPLPTDNVRHAVAHVLPRLRVLCVDGDPSPRPFQGETAYLQVALAPKPQGPRAGSLEVKAVPWLALPAQRLAEAQVVILANVPDVRDEGVRALARFVQNGGGLILFLGDKTVPRVLNARLRVGDRSLLPARIDPPRTAPDEEWPLALAAPDHPLTRALAALPPELLARATVRRAFELQPLPEARTVLALAGTEAPLLVEKPFGRGSVLLCATTADRAWTDLITHPAGPILLHQAITHLTRPAHERPFTVGEPLLVPVPQRDGTANVVFRDPQGTATPVQPMQRDGERVAESPPTEWAGFYEVQQDGAAVTAAVNVDPTESDAKCLHGPALSRAVRGLPVRVLAPEADALAAIQQGRVGTELWRMLMVLALAVLLVEAFLAHRFSRRMAVREDVLGASAPTDLLAEEET